MKLKLFLTLFIMMTLAGLAQAGKITSVPTPATGSAGFGGWNLTNVTIDLNGTGSWYDELTGGYHFAEDSDFTYDGKVNDGYGELMGYVLAKDWPVGEPAGIKVINDDLAVKAPKPANCIMATSYLAGHYLDSADPQQVTCSGPYQSHKRYKIAMLPASVDENGAEGIDLVFNVEAEAGSRDYQIFQKINNWTGKRLEGFSVQVGFGVGEDFQTVAEAGIDLENLNIAVPSAIWDAGDLATFSAGLFGPLDKHTGKRGFFDPSQRAGFYIDEYVDGIQDFTDTLTATRTLGSAYAEVPLGASIENQFGPWLSDNMLPYGIFFDDDGNPDTDASLLAWYGYNPAIAGFGWMGGSQDGNGPFSEISNSEIKQMGENLSYTMDVIEDLVNVGLNYVVSVGDVGTFPGSTFTIRVTPTPDTSGANIPGYVGLDPEPLLLFTSSDAKVLIEPVETFAIGSLLTARIGDADLNLSPDEIDKVEVVVSMDSGFSTTVNLVEQGKNRGVFASPLPARFSNVAAGTVVTLTYVDANNSTGESITKTSSTVAYVADEPILSDANITEFIVPETMDDGKTTNLKVTVTNDKQSEGAATGQLVIAGSDGSLFTGEIADLAPNKKAKFNFRWTASLADRTTPETVNWTVSVIVADQTVDEVTASTLVEVKTRGKNKKN